MGKNKKNERGRNVTNKSKQLIKDFEKKKRKKLGKKLKPANTTEISFRSHSIHISKQSLKDQNRELRKSLALITFDIQQALIGLSHHKCKVRRDVLVELKAILSRIEDEPNKFRNVLHENLVEIVSIFELVYDCEHIVRNTLKTFVNWFMPRCKDCIELFGPFWSCILAHLSAALSHIDIKIRYNALKILRSFFSVSSVANYFNIKWCLSLLSHLELLFYDIIRNGHFILNDDDIKIITCLRNNNNNNNSNNNNDYNSQKVAKTSSSHQETQVIVHILCDCCMHIIRVIQRQMHNSYDTLENNLHSLLLPNDNKMNKMELDGDNDEFDMINNDNMQLLTSLLSIFTSCCLIFEQFGAKNKYSAMGMVLALCYIISECLCDETLKELINNQFNYQQKKLEKIKAINKKNKNKNKKYLKLFKINDYRIFISKSLMSLFNVFPIEYVEQIQVYDNDNENENDDGKENENVAMDIDKQGINQLNVMQMNIKTMKMCNMFIEYWKLNLLQNENRKQKKKRDYFKISYEWLYNSLVNIASNDEKDINTKILIDLLQILKTLIPFYQEKKQLRLLLKVDKLMRNSQFRNDAKTIFAQFVN